MLCWYLRLIHLLRSQRGQDLVEYSLILTFVALCATFIILGVGGGVSTIWSQIDSVVQEAVGAI